MLPIIIAVLLALGGIGAIVNGSIIWGIILIVAACLIGPGGSYYSRR